MGQVGSCCGARSGKLGTPSPPSQCISALGNTVVTFESGQEEGFAICCGAWKSTAGYEVLDLDKAPWFRLIESASDEKHKQNSAKNLMLNTGLHHATMERANDGTWSISVAGERRVSIDRAPGSQYNIFIHPYPYPSDLARVDLDTLNPSLYVIGNPRDYEYCFIESGNPATSSVAVVSSQVDPSFLATPGFRVQIAARVDVALILLATMAIDASEHDFVEEPARSNGYGRAPPARAGKRHETLPQHLQSGPATPGRVHFEDTHGWDKPPKRQPPVAPSAEPPTKQAPAPPLRKQAGRSDGVQV